MKDELRANVVSVTERAKTEHGGEGGVMGTFLTDLRVTLSPCREEVGDSRAPVGANSSFRHRFSFMQRSR